VRIVAVTCEALQRFNRAAYDELCGRLRGAGKDPAQATWVYEWDLGSPRFNVRHQIQDMSRGRPYVPRNSESDIHVNVAAVVAGQVYARRVIPLVPEEVKVQARPFLR
jgi:hypothetical protein